MSLNRKLISVVLVAAAVATYLGFNWWSRSSASAYLPARPDLTGRPVAMVQHIADADAAARRSPTDAAVVGTLGMAYHSNLFYDEATSAYSLAASLDPTGWRWIYYRALVHFERGEAKPAENALKAVVASQPTMFIAWWRLAESGFKQGQYDVADAAYARAEQDSAVVTDRPALNAYARVGRARVALQRGRAAEAQRILAKVIEAEPRFGAATRVLAEATRAEGRNGDANLDTTLAAQRAYAAPNDPLVEVLADMSRSSIFLLRHAASIDLLRSPARREHLTRRALDVDPDNPDVVYEMGAVLQQLGRPADALPYLSRHLQMVTDDQQTLVQIGKCYIDLGQLDEAEKALRQALEIGADAIGFHNLGLVLERRERFAEAESAYRKAIEIGPGLASTRNNLGSLLARSGRFDEATTHLRESSRLDPSSPDAYTNLAAVMLQRGEFAPAARYARLAIVARPRHADAHVNLAVALARLGDFDEARRHLDEALSIDPRHATARANREALAR